VKKIRICMPRFFRAAGRARSADPRAEKSPDRDFGIMFSEFSGASPDLWQFRRAGCPALRQAGGPPLLQNWFQKKQCAKVMQFNPNPILITTEPFDFGVAAGILPFHEPKTASVDFQRLTDFLFMVREQVQKECTAAVEGVRPAPFVLHGWLRSGNAGAARGVVPFLQEALALLPEGTSLPWSHLRRRFQLQRSGGKNTQDEILIGFKSNDGPEVRPHPGPLP
jgi:hypothetical protein